MFLSQNPHYFSVFYWYIHSILVHESLDAGICKQSVNVVSSVITLSFRACSLLIRACVDIGIVTNLQWVVGRIAIVTTYEPLGHERLDYQHLEEVLQLYFFLEFDKILPYRESSSPQADPLCLR